MFAFLRVLGTILLGLVGWVIVGYLLTIPLGAIFGWSGHPAVPDAPVPIYVALYIVAIPALCLFAAWRVVRRIEKRIRGWGEPEGGPRDG
jgi:ABC-type polysaccharide/polyol phosphate export permease